MKNNCNLTRCALILMILAVSTFANMGGATPKPGLTGAPLVLDTTTVGVLKEELVLDCYEEGTEKKCRFEATYYLSSHAPTNAEILCVFYGLNADNVQIELDNSPIHASLDSPTVSKVDSIVRATVHRRTRGDAVWYDWKTLSRTGFRLRYTPGNENVLRISGIISLQPTDYWYGIYTPALYAKHPVFNKKAGKGGHLLQYLVNPIRSWGFSGPIHLTLKYPRRWKAYSDFFDKEDERLQSPDSPVIVEKTFTDSLPDILTIRIPKDRQILHPGGPEICIGVQKKSGFMMRYGWEFGAQIGWVNVLCSLPIETDYQNETRFCPTIMGATPWFAFIFPSLAGGLGAAIPLSGDSKPWLRLRGDANLGPVGLSLNLDNRGSEWRTTILGRLSI